MEDRPTRSELDQNGDDQHHGRENEGHDKRNDEGIDAVPDEAALAGTEIAGEDQTGRPKLPGQNSPEGGLKGHRRFLEVDAGKAQLQHLVNRQFLAPFRHADNDQVGLELFCNAGRSRILPSSFPPGSGS